MGARSSARVAAASGLVLCGRPARGLHGRAGAWGRGTALLTHSLPCDGSVTTVEVTTLPAGRMHVELRDLPADTVGAYAVLRPTGPFS